MTNEEQVFVRKQGYSLGQLAGSWGEGLFSQFVMLLHNKTFYYFLLSSWVFDISLLVNAELGKLRAREGA